MRQLFLTLALVVSGLLSAQNSGVTEQFGDATFYGNVNTAGNRYAYVYNTLTPIKNLLPTGNETPEFNLFFSPDGTWNISLYYFGWTRDSSGSDKNYLTVDFMVDGDKSNIITAQGEIKSDKYVYVGKAGDVTKLIKQNSKTIYIRVSVGDTVRQIFKGSLAGFTTAWNRAYEYMSQEDVDPFETGGNDDPFNKYLESYVSIAKSVGVDLSFIYDGTINIYFEDLSSVGGPDKTILGIARGSRNDDVVDVVIDKAMWEKLTDLEKTTLLYHELSHDILNAAHVDDALHIMHPSNVYDNTVDLVNGLIEVLVQYREGTMIKF